MSLVKGYGTKPELAVAALLSSLRANMNRKQPGCLGSQIFYFLGARK